MTPQQLQNNVPRWKQGQVESRLKQVEAGSAMVGARAMAQAEDESIDRLLKESEKRGLEQRETWAKRQCGDSSTGGMSRPPLLRRKAPSVESGLEAEKAALDTIEGELNLCKRPLVSSQCQNRVAEHWGLPTSEETMVFEREALADTSSQACDGGSSRVNRRETTSGDNAAGWRLAFEPCRAALEACCRKKEMEFAGLGPVLSRALAVVETRLERCSQPKGDLFPLPLGSDLGLHGQRTPNSDALIRALNLLYGTKTKTRAKEEGIRRTLTDRLNQVVQTSSLLEEKLPQLDFHQLFQSKSVDYSGEEVQVARSFQWKMIEAAMPHAVGSLELESFCDGGTLNYVREFENFLMPPQDQHLGRTPAIMVEQRHWAEVCSGLLSRGVCRVMHVSELHHVNGRPLLNGLFAASKQETAMDADGNPFEVCRLIMNLVPTNSCCRSLVGDTSTLPSVVGMSAVVLEDSQLLITSSEDIRCFFYLFRTPTSWWKYMGFAREVPQEALPASCSGTGWHLVTQVLPMGFINSVAIAQHVHPEVRRHWRQDTRSSVGTEGFPPLITCTGCIWTTMMSCARLTVGWQRLWQANPQRGP